MAPDGGAEPQVQEDPKQSPVVEPVASAPAVDPTVALAALQAKHDALVAKVGDGTKIPTWLQSRLDAEVGRRGTAERAQASAEAEVTRLQARVSQLEAELAAAGGTLPVAPRGTPAAGGGFGASPRTLVVGTPEYQQAVAEEARRQAEHEARLAEENTSAERGKAAYPDFDDAIASLRNVGELPPHFLETALATGGAEHVLYKLGKDLDKAAAVAKLPLAKMAVEMSKLAEPPAAPAEPPKPKPSSAPTPIAPVGSNSGVGNPGSLRDDIPLEEWLSRRTKQVRGK